ncbi:MULTISPECIES: efflux RND transporter periplasmic adaptor subunit [Pseudomonas]|uniref:efflux RND transporter periplasmic adaptor subunit n=1 Tax=Pseudomonas TaxID=286 RepID=UPI00398FE09C
MSICAFPLMPVACLVTSAALVGCSPGKSEPPATPVAQVSVLTVQPQHLAISTQLPGRTTARMVAQIRPQVGGIVQKRLFTEGAEVKAGTVLYQIDPASYQAALDSAQASLAKAQAAQRSAQLQATRYTGLVKIDAISRQDNETAQATLLEANAEVKSAQAAVNTARINLAYTRITAPISGRTEASTVTPGALVSAEQTTALTTVQQLDPIYIDITQSSADLLRLKRELASGVLHKAEDGGASIDVVLEDGSDYGHKGSLKVSGLTVSASTGSITLRAEVANPDELLMPGMYVRAVLQEGVDEQALLVPQQAVTRDERGETSLLVVVDGKVQQRSVTASSAVGSQWHITEGLKAGDTVVVEGGQKVRMGDAVQTHTFDSIRAGGVSSTSAAQ